MAGKRKRGSGGLEADAAEAAAKKSRKAAAAAVDTARAARADVGKFSIKSSLKAPFVVVSNKEFVGAVPAPEEEEWRDLLAYTREIVQQWEARRAVITADFEGEMTGLEGRLYTAAFQRTFTLDTGLRPMQLGHTKPNLDLGLFIDLRCAEGKRLVKQIMESKEITKLIWGADGDITSLRYTPPSKPLGIESASVVDVQLGFSSKNRRLGMATMLQRVPAASVAGLPGKDVIDFAGGHSKNQKVLTLPLPADVACYAVDDLHRLDAILRTQKPKPGSYSQARNDTDMFCLLAFQNPASTSQTKLQSYDLMMRKQTGTKRAVAAVAIKRHIMAARMLGLQHVAEEAQLEMEKAADEVLAEQGVVIPEDLTMAPAA